MERRTGKKLLAIGTTGLVSSASIFDAFIHTFPAHRFMLGKIIGNHIGNTIDSAGPVIIATGVGEIISHEGARRNNKILETFGKALPFVALGVMAIANFNAENFPGNYQFAGDLTDGLLTLPLAYIATKTAIELYRSASNQKKIQKQIMADDRLLW
jgi:hypothetical protein